LKVSNAKFYLGLVAAPKAGVLSGPGFFFTPKKTLGGAGVEAFFFISPENLQTAASMVLESAAVRYYCA